MFSNVSARSRRRLRVAVVAWAVLLLAVSFAASRATVSEQIGADDARAALDALLGEAAAGLGGASVLAAGPLDVEDCDVTPVRPGLSLSRTLQVSGATKDGVTALADRLGLVAWTAEPDTAGWSGIAEGYLDVRITADGADPVGGRWTDPVEIQAATGCRPADDPLAVFAPDPPLGASADWRYGAVPCPGGETLSSWTEPVQARPFLVHESTGGCA